MGSHYAHVANVNHVPAIHATVVVAIHALAHQRPKRKLDVVVTRKSKLLRRVDAAATRRLKLQIRVDVAATRRLKLQRSLDVVEIRKSKLLRRVNLVEIRKKLKHKMSQKLLLQLEVKRSQSRSKT